ncbi:hypothetical protein OG953_04360 [Streptomyces sp. NBC_00057]
MSLPGGLSDAAERLGEGSNSPDILLDSHTPVLTVQFAVQTLVVRAGSRRKTAVSRAVHGRVRSQVTARTAVGLLHHAPSTGSLS